MKLTEILAKFQNVTEEADGYVAQCPAHDDTHASLRVALSQEGNLLLNCRAGCSFDAVMAELPLRKSDLFGVEADRPAPTITDQKAPISVGDRAQMGAYLASCADRLVVEGAQAMEYAQRRFGISPDLAKRLGLGFDPGGGTETFHLLGAVHHAAERLVVPFYDVDGIPSGFQSRALNGHPVRWAGPVNPPAGGSWSKLAFFRAESGLDFVVVAEGPGDALTAVAAGLDSVGIRGAALGAGVAEGLAENLRGRRVILAGDNDAAGVKMNTALADRLTELGLSVFVLALPDGYGDLSEWYEATPETFASEFQKAVFTAPAYSPAERPSVPVDEPEEDELEDLPKSHVEIARMVVDYFGGRLVYLLGLGFHIYENGVWVEDRLGRVRLTVHEIGDQYADQVEAYKERVREADATYAVTGSDRDRDALQAATQRLKALHGLIRFLRNTMELDRIEKEVGGLVRRENTDFDSHPDLLVVRNGTVDLRTGELGPHDPDLLITQKVDTDYIPDAACPRWETFVSEVFPDSPGVPDYTRRLVGYGITGHTTEQCFAVLWGRGANGKSVFTETLLDVFSGIAKATPFSTFEDKPGGGGIPNDIAALRGARLVFASEGERGKPMAESVIKRVTGQDMISARFMRKEFFEFRPSFLLFMASNHKPYFRSADEGLWRRVKMIPWTRFFTPEERDPYLRQRMVAEESEGILAWAVRGSVEWYKNGLGDPETVIRATDSYRDASDPLSGFYPHGPLRPDPDGEVKGTDVWGAYIEWCDVEMMPPKERWGRNTLLTGLEERGLLKIRTNRGVVIRGASLGSGA